MTTWCSTTAAVLLALVCVAGPISVQGWNCFGHMMVTEIALSNISAGAREHFAGVSKYFAGRYDQSGHMTEQACWPDDIKQTTEEYSSWHYFDQCYSAKANPFPCPRKPGGGKLGFGLYNAFHNSFLNNATENMVDYGFWFIFLLHLVGDAHQPLHTCTLYSPQFPHSDNAGTAFHIYDGSHVEPLHMFADAVADKYRHVKRPFALHPGFQDHMHQEAMDIKARYPVAPAIAQDIAFSTWLKEGLVACGSLYEHGKLKNYEHITNDYKASMQTMLEGRVAVAGARLATMMELVYLGNREAALEQLMRGSDPSIIDSAP